MDSNIEEESGISFGKVLLARAVSTSLRGVASTRAPHAGRGERPEEHFLAGGVSAGQHSVL